MRGMIGALLFAGLVAGCGGAMENAPDDTTLPAAPSESPDEVTAMACTYKSVCCADYFYSNGVECGLQYRYCDGRVVQSGCYTSTYTSYCYCPFP